MSQYSEVIKSVKMGDAIASRVSDDLKHAFHSGDLTQVLEASFVQSHTALVYRDDEGNAFQITNDTVRSIDDYRQRMAPLYAGIDHHTTQLRTDIDHDNAIRAVVAHYCTNIQGEFTKVLADAEALYLLRDTSSGVQAQTRVNLAEILAVDVVRSLAGSISTENPQDAQALLQRYSLIERQIKQSLAVVRDAKEAIEAAAAAMTKAAKHDST